MDFKYRICNFLSNFCLLYLSLTLSFEIVKSMLVEFFKNVKRVYRSSKNNAFLEDPTHRALCFLYLVRL